MTFSYTFDEATGHVNIKQGSTRIPDSYFLGNDQIQSVFIPDSITAIDNHAFSGCNLAEVVIPDSVTFIGWGAFKGNNLTEVAIPDSVTSIRDTAFHDNDLANVVIPDSVTSIGRNAFSGNNLTEVAIPDSVTSIGSMAFQGNNLTTVVIPDTVIHVEGGTFSDNNLNEVHIGSSVVQIDGGAFRNNKLKSIVIPDSVRRIGNSAFRDNELIEVAFPDSVSEIGDGAFKGNNLTKVKLPIHFDPLFDGLFYHPNLPEAFDLGVTLSFADPDWGTPEPEPEPEPGVSATVIDGETSEDGDTAQVSVVLDTKPLEDVTISFVVSDASEARIKSGQTLVFTSLNWDQAQTVTVEGIDDSEADWLLDGAQDFILSGSLSSADPNYGPRRDGTGGVKVENISLSNLDRDDAGRTVIGTNANDRIVLGDQVDRQSGNGPDRVYAGNGRDYVEGGGEDDSLYGENDDDTLVGGAGDDVLDGGSGEDTAVFSGRYADYTISSSSNVRDDSITVKDLRAGSADGVDVLDDVEWLQFADRSIQIDETGPAPAYRVSVSSSNVNEGDSLTTTVSTENLIAGTNLFWKLEGDVRKADLKPGRIRGKASVDADGTFTFSHSLKQDLETEGTETFVVKLYSDSRLSKEVATSGLVTVQDTSISGEPAGPIIGSSGNDRLLGTNNDDVISGEGGNDRLIGKKGDDLLMGGSGNDKLKGGLGADTFVVSSGMDKMLDVKLAQGDVIEIAGDKEYELVTKGRNVLLMMEDGSETFIKNMSVSALEEGGLQVV